MTTLKIPYLFSSYLLFSFLLLIQITAGADTTITTYYIPDPQGSPIAAMDEQGNIKWRKHYRPFGAEIEQGQASKDNRIGYTGHVPDRDTGLTYMGARYYDPVIGRFMSMDPASVNPNDPASFNRYAYGKNNPYIYVDPDGKAPQWIFGRRPKLPGWSLRAGAGYGRGMGTNGRIDTGRSFDNRSYKSIADEFKKIEAERYLTKGDSKATRHSE